jgi:drug/metabolite transporter (DMT)-like permease
MTINNIGVTLINKAAFAMVHFPYPYMLTVIHMLINWMACEYIFYTIGHSHNSNNIWIQLLGNSDDLHAPTKLSSSTQLSAQQQPIWVIGVYSVIFSLNIAIGNVSLQHVSVNFNQVMRSLVPVITLWCSWYCLNQRNISVQRRMAIWPVVVGVAMAAIGDRMSVTTIGFIYTFLCVVLAAVKVVSSSEILSGSLKMHPLRLLQRMAPLAFIQCLLLSIWTGEFAIIRQRWYIDLDPFSTGNWIPIAVLFISGILAFSLNICALQAYKVTSPITCCIAAAVKQVLMVVLGTYMFHTKITPLNGFGIVVVLIGSTYYSYISITEPKFNKASTSATTMSGEGTHKNNDDIEMDNGKDVPITVSGNRHENGDTTMDHGSGDNDSQIEEGVALIKSNSPSSNERHHTSTVTARR